HKVAVIRHLDALGESAATIGAVNCVVKRDGRLIGENTDGKGFVDSLRTLVDPAGKTLVLFGAELVALINDRTPARAELVVWDRPYRAPEAADILVNATSIGLYPDIDGRLALDMASLRPAMIVADVIPNPPRTLLIREAQALGCRTLDGLGMLVNQGVISIRHWTGVDVTAAVMRRTVEGLFGV
ncbi:MAG: shikimate dehydrogenase, partial [Roseiarcus sp.]